MHGKDLRFTVSPLLFCFSLRGDHGPYLRADILEDDNGSEEAEKYHVTIALIYLKKQKKPG